MCHYLETFYVTIRFHKKLIEKVVLTIYIIDLNRPQDVKKNIDVHRMQFTCTSFTKKSLTTCCIDNDQLGNEKRFFQI